MQVQIFASRGGSLRRPSAFLYLRSSHEEKNHRLLLHDRGSSRYDAGMSEDAVNRRGRAAGQNPRKQGGRRAGAAGGRRAAAGAAGQGGRRAAAGAGAAGGQGRGRRAGAGAAGAGPVTLTAAEARAIANAFQWFAVNREGESAVALLGLLKRSFRKGK